MSQPILHDYHRSSAAYRVRIALNLKGVSYRSVPVDLLKGEQGGEDYRGLNPQGLVPMLEIDGLRLTQSLAILDYLDARFPKPRLVPRDPAARAHVLAMGLMLRSANPPTVRVRPPASRWRVGAPATKVKNSLVRPEVWRPSAPMRSSMPSPSGGRSSTRPPMPIAGTLY
jgi:glutathione S-transferase